MILICLRLHDGISCVHAAVCPQVSCPVEFRAYPLLQENSQISLKSTAEVEQFDSPFSGELIAGHWLTMKIIGL